MTYKTVMVGLALGQPNDARLEVSAQLAERFGARVIGIAAAEFSPPLYFTEGEPAQRLINQGWAAVKNRLKELESEFRAAMQSPSPVPSSFVVKNGSRIRSTASSEIPQPVSSTRTMTMWIEFVPISMAAIFIGSL
jgi:hypothetical protein